MIVFETSLVLPTASVNAPALTFIVVAPSASGVNVAVYVVPALPDATNVSFIEPFVTVTSPETKLVVASLEVNVTAKVPSFVVVPFTTGAVVIVIVGAVVSTTNALESANEFAAPGAGSVNTAAFPLTSFIVPPDKANALVET